MYKPLPNNLKIACSKIHGHGIFAIENISLGDIIGRSHVEGLDEIIRTPLGGFINHSEDPNCELIEEDGDYHYKKLKTIRKIEEGEELTLKYSLYAICDYL